MSFQKGPVHKLPEGITRYEIVYRIQTRDGWRVKRMWKTDKVGKDEEIGRALYQRLVTKPNQFEIITVRDIGGEIPIQTGQPMQVLTPSEYETQRALEQSRFSRTEVEERAKELGLWYPGMGEKFDA